MKYGELVKNIFLPKKKQQLENDTATNVLEQVAAEDE